MRGPVACDGCVDRSFLCCCGISCGIFRGVDMKYWICVVMVACSMTGCNLLKSSAQSEDAQEENAQAVLAETPVDKDNIDNDNIDNEKVDKLNNNQSDGENDNIDGVNGEKLDVSVKGEDKSPFFETRVSWPEFDIAHADKAVYAIESGSNSEGAWFEGKGYFHGSLEAFVRDMNDPMIMGPSNVTKMLSRQNAIDQEDKHHYDLHVEMDYIFTVEFDITVDIDVSAEGIHYESHKTRGTSVIKRLDEVIEIKKLSDEWYSVSFQSKYDALVVKEKETREHFELLFARWSGDAM